MVQAEREVIAVPGFKQICQPHEFSEVGDLFLGVAAQAGESLPVTAPLRSTFFIAPIVRIGLLFLCAGAVSPLQELQDGRVATLVFREPFGDRRRDVRRHESRCPNRTLTP